MAVLSILLFPPFLFLLAAAVLCGLSDLVEVLRPHEVASRAPQGA